MMSRQITQQSKTNISAPAGGKTVIFVSTYALKCCIFICKKEKKVQETIDLKKKHRRFVQIQQ